MESDIYPVSPRISGHVLKVLVEENDTVSDGQLLVEIDPHDYEVAVSQARASLAQANSAAEAAAGTAVFAKQTATASVGAASAQVAAAKAGEATAQQQSETAASQVEAAEADEAAAVAGVEVARRAVAAAEAGLANVQAQANLAQKNAGRMRKLLEEGAVSAQQCDAAVTQSVSAQSAVDVDKASVESSKAALKQAEQRQRQASISVTQAVHRAAAAVAQVAQAKAATEQALAGLRSAQATPVQTEVRKSEAKGARERIAEAEAGLQKAELNLSYTHIVAPVDGVVAKKGVEPGQFVQPGQALLAIVATASSHIAANFKETQVKQIRPGQRATFTVDAYPGTVFSGSVESVSPGTGAVFSLLPPENASGNFTKVVQRISVRIAVDPTSDPGLALRAGMSVVVSVDVR